MTNPTAYPGMSQSQRQQAALSPDYYALDERSLLDHLRMVQRYVQRLRFHDEASVAKGQEIAPTEKRFWQQFLKFSDAELTAMAELAENPQLLDNRADLREKFALPHYNLLLTFIQLLAYPKARLKQLTREHLEFCYRTSLQITTKDAKADEVHVIFELADYIEQITLKAGTRLAAGLDDEGLAVEYQLEQDLNVNHAQVTDIKAIQYSQSTVGLQQIREQAGEGIAGFEAMLKHALGGVETLPEYPKSRSKHKATDVSYLLNQWFPRIRDKAPQDLMDKDRHYILEKLHFSRISDCQYVFTVLYNEIRQGLPKAQPLTAGEWARVYRIFTALHREVHSRQRRAEIKAIHLQDGFNALLNLLFGDPEPGNFLYSLPPLAPLELSEPQQQWLEKYPLAMLYYSSGRAAERYVNQHLAMSLADFQAIFARVLGESQAVPWWQVYRILERAWTKKRNYVYPSVEKNTITGISKLTHHQDSSDATVAAFAPFPGEADATTNEDGKVEMGLLLSSELLSMQQGQRKFDLVLSCQPGTLALEDIAQLAKYRLNGEPQAVFKAYLSTADGWQAVAPLQVQYGELISMAARDVLPPGAIQLHASVGDAAISEQLRAGQYVLLPKDHSYKIAAVHYDEQRLLLEPANFQATTTDIRLIERFTPQQSLRVIQGNSCYDAQQQQFYSDQEDFEPTYVGKVLVDQQGQIYHINAFIDANTLVVAAICQLPVDADPRLNNQVWQHLDVTYNDQLSLASLSIDSLSIDDQRIQANVSANQLSLFYPAGISSQAIVAHWQHLLLTQQLDPERFSLTLLQDQVMNDAIRALPEQDSWLKRYESLHPFGLTVTQKGRRDDKPRLSILPPQETGGTDFAVSNNELLITLGSEYETANTLAAAWQHWQQQNPQKTADFEVLSRDQRLWPVTPLSEQPMLKLDKQEKLAYLTDDEGNGIRISYIGPAAMPAGVVLTEHLINEYDFTIDANNQLLVHYPATTETFAGSLVQAWQKWQADVFNDPGNFSIALIGEDVFDIVGQSQFDIAGRFQATLSLSRAAVTLDYPLYLEYLGPAISDGAQVQVVQGDVITPQFILQADGTLVITLPLTPVNVQQFLSGWVDWQGANPEKALSRQLSFIAPQNSDLSERIELQRQSWQKIGESGTIGDNGLHIDYSIADNLLHKVQAKIICQEQSSSAGSEYGFSYEDDQLNDCAVLTIHYPTDLTLRTIAQLLNAWQNHTGHEHWGFSLTMAGKGSWQVRGETRLLLNATSRAYYQLRTEQMPYLQIDYQTTLNGVPHITLSPGSATEFDFQVEQTDGVSNLTIHYPQLPGYCRLSRLLAKWLPLQQDFILSDSSERIVARASAELAATGNQSKQFNHSGIRFEYQGPAQDVTLQIEANQAVNADNIDQQLLLDNGQLITLNQQMDSQRATIASMASTGLRYQRGRYPRGAIKSSAIRIQGQVDAEFPAVAALQTESEDNMAKPGLKLVLNNQFVQYPGTLNEQLVFLYPIFKSIVIEQAELAVDVQGMSAVAARSSDLVVDPQALFAPFGELPQSGAAFEFSHPELAGKPLQALTLQYQWVGLEDPQTRQRLSPPDLRRYYHQYSRLGDQHQGDISNLDFTVSLEYFSGNRWHSLQTDQPLLVTEQHFDQLHQQASEEQGLVLNPDATDPRNLAARFRLRLQHGVLNEVFPRLRNQLSVYGQQAVQVQSQYDTAYASQVAFRELVQASKLAAAQAKADGVAYYPPAIPKPMQWPPLRPELQEASQRDIPRPYTPALAYLRVGYRAANRVSLQDRETISHLNADPRVPLPLNIYRYQPFGLRRMGLAQDPDDVLLPAYEKQGCLFLGISQIQPGQTVSLLFQILTGSGNPHQQVPGASWRYLAGENWHSLPDSYLLREQTQGLQDSGLVQIQIPPEASVRHTLMPAGRIWLEIAFADNIQALPTIIAVRAQAITAKMIVNANNQSRLVAPLAANSISGLLPPVPGINQVSQPYVSFNGEPAEQAQDYQQRVAERLQHKNRCLTVQDYERMVLAEFPDIFQVKCLPTRLIQAERQEQGMIQESDTSDLEQDLHIIVVAKNGGAEGVQATRPKVSTRLLRQIKHFVDQHKPATVSTAVVNPGFEELSYRLAVKFKAGRDPGYYATALNQAIIQFMSPWNNINANNGLSFGNTIYSADIVRFIESLDYIDYVANFTLLRQIIQHSDYTEIVPLFLTEDHAATAKQQGAILVSAARHSIDVIETDLYDADAFKGIGFMQVGLDFWVDRPAADFNRSRFD